MTLKNLVDSAVISADIATISVWNDSAGRYEDVLDYFGEYGDEISDCILKDENAIPYFNYEVSLLQTYTVAIDKALLRIEISKP